MLASLLANGLLLARLASALAAPLEDRTSGTSPADACAAINTALGGSNVYYDGQPGYESEQSNYWNAGLRQNIPACIVRPQTTAQVSTVVKTLRKFGDVKYAVKSGGHDPNPGHSGINGGVLISLFDMAGATYDSAKGVCYVKPGGRWQNVIDDLAPSGYAVLGGRLGVVGVGGYLTGGGLSFLSAQYGLAADTMVEFETVMANGSVAHINAQNNKDLFRAMKGSTNQYGIVTQFTMKAVPVNQVWGGLRLYTGLSLDDLYAAFANFTSNPPDPKAAVILTIEKLAGNIIPVVFYFYDGPTPPKGAFSSFLDIPYVIDTTKSQTYGSLLAANAQGAGNMTTRTSFSSLTLPLLPGSDGPAFLKDIINIWSASDPAYWLNPLHALNIGSIAYQSFPSLIGAHSEAAGGNAMGLKGSDGPRFIVEQSYIYSGDASDDKTIWDMSTALVQQWTTQTLPGYVQKLKAQGVGVQSYQPYFANDALYSQPVFQSYRETALFKRLQRENDPDGFIANRAGGFKY